MKRILNNLNTIDLIGLGGVALVVMIGVIFLAKEWGII